MVKRVFISWIGEHDVRDNASGKKGNSPIISILHWRHSNGMPFFDHIHLIYNEKYKNNIQGFELRLESLTQKMTGQPKLHTIQFIDKLTDPSDYSQIYTQVINELKRYQSEELNQKDTTHKEIIEYEWHFNLSSGTNAMTVIWVLLSTNYRRVLYHTWLDKESGESKVKIVDLPFDVSYQFIDKKARKDYDQSVLIGSSPQIQEVKRQAEKYRKYDIPVLIHGETGTGKENTAKLLVNPEHLANKFFTINCACFTPTLIQSELFGHEKNAFTDAKELHKGIFETYDEGTVFLDEIGELNLELQSNLLRFIEYGTFTRMGGTKVIKSNVRIIAATNRDLLESVKNREFREDLYYRLNIGYIEIPPLRERGNDIIEIAEHFLSANNEEFSKKAGYQIKQFDASAKDFLLKCYWKGNVRELIHTLTRLCIHYDDKAIITAPMIKQELWNYTDGKPKLIYAPEKPIDTPIDTPTDTPIDTPPTEELQSNSPEPQSPIIEKNFSEQEKEPSEEKLTILFPLPHSTQISLDENPKSIDLMADLYHLELLAINQAAELKKTNTAASNFLGYTNYQTMLNHKIKAETYLK